MVGENPVERSTMKFFLRESSKRSSKVTIVHVPSSFASLDRRRRSHQNFRRSPPNSKQRSRRQLWQTSYIASKSSLLDKPISLRPRRFLKTGGALASSG